MLSKLSIYSSRFWHCFLALFLMVATVEATTPELLNFQQLTDSEKLSHLHQRTIRIRGFLYQNNDGHFILAAEPNLKSCCLKKISKERQIALVNFLDIPPEYGRAVIVEGRLMIDMAKNNKWPFLYYLENASIVKEEIIINPSYLILGICLLLFIGIAIFFLSKR